jgi:excisionase family DNA binding protein
MDSRQDHANVTRLTSHFDGLAGGAGSEHDPHQLEPAPHLADLRLLDADTLSELWGVKKSWIYDQVEAGKLPAVRLGKQLRFRHADLESYLDQAVTKQDRSALRPTCPSRHEGFGSSTLPR